MTATLDHRATGLVGRSTVRPRRSERRDVGEVPLSRPVVGAPTAAPTRIRVTGRPQHRPVSCRVASPRARRNALVMRIKVATIGLLALVGVGASAAEFASWSHPDPAVDYVAGDPAWAHVTGR